MTLVVFVTLVAVTFVAVVMLVVRHKMPLCLLSVLISGSVVSPIAALVLRSY